MKIDAVYSCVRGEHTGSVICARPVEMRTIVLICRINANIS
jgi:hypothetical protein